MGRTHLNPFSGLSQLFCNSSHSHCFSCGSNNHLLSMLDFDGVVVNNSVFCHSPDSIDDKALVIKDFIDKMSDNGNEKSGNLKTDRETSSSSDFLKSARNEDQSRSSSSESFSSHSNYSDIYGHIDKVQLDNPKTEKQSSPISEIDLMKERFSKLLLGEDMSGSGNGVCTALAISNAITNLCTSVFGQIWRLEPLPYEKKLLWRREMQWLLSVSDHIVEFIPTSQTFTDGSKLEAMTCRTRTDLCANLPALCKLDNMLVDILDSFEKAEFWYVEQGIVEGTSSFRGSLLRQEEKWWLPVPQIPPGGLTAKCRNKLQQERDCTNQILKAAMAINSATLSEMQVPRSYLDALPKNARACLGDPIHRYITSGHFFPQFLLPCLDLSSEHKALEMVNRVEASIYLWRRKDTSKPLNNTNRSSSKSSWEIVKDIIVDSERSEFLAARAETLLLYLKQRFTGLPQTTLDMCKIQCNKDVGKSIVESYSRVLESLAFNMIARIDDLLYVDNMCRESNQLLSSISRTVDCKNVRVSTPNLSPCSDFGSIAEKEGRSPLLESSELSDHCLHGKD